MRPDAAREIMWNISNPGLMYLFFAGALGIFLYGLYRRTAAWKRGKADSERFSHLFLRFLRMARSTIFQQKTFNTLYPGVFHGLIFFPFLALVMVTTVIGMDYDFGTSLFVGQWHLFWTLLAEAAGVMLLAGIAMALWRRHVIKPRSLDRSFQDTAWLLFMALLVITGYLVEGLRISATNDPWAGWSFLGQGISAFFSGVPRDILLNLHAISWWLHLAMAMVWIAAIPYSKFMHILLVPVNAFFGKVKPPGELSRIDIETLMERADLSEDDFTIGIGNTGDFTWKQLMDLDACVSCGRCEDACPSAMAGETLSPKAFVLNMRNLIKPHEDSTTDIVRKAFDEQFIWLCRTCMACVHICPAHVEHVDTLMEIRRNEVSMKGRLPAQASDCLKLMESLGNPFGSKKEGNQWVRALDAPVIGIHESCDVLYWMGCFAFMDPVKRQIAEDFCRLLKTCGVDFGILGEEEHCCGDPARILGDENLFQMMAKKQVTELNLRKFNTLAVSCPHGYNVLKNEYPQFGGHYRVVHYTELLYDLVEQGKLKPVPGRNRIVAFHDPCYLGRYQQIYDAPRKLIDAIPGIKRVEMAGNRGKSLCCGGGGGHFWMDLKQGERISHIRVRQALDAKVDAIVTACPYCRHMLEDGIRHLNLEENLEVVDIGALISGNSPNEQPRF